MNTSPPLVFGNIVVIPTALENGRLPKSMKYPKGDIMAFDARTGKKLWVFHTIPRPGEFGADTWERQLECVYRQRRRMGAVRRGRRARISVPAGRSRDRRSVRRTASRKQSVFVVAGGSRYQDRQADLASAARASRHLGLRSADGPDSCGHYGGRSPNQGRRSADEDGVCIRLRSHERNIRCGRSTSDPSLKAMCRARRHLRRSRSPQSRPLSTGRA